MLQFDHITMIAPTLEEGIQHLSACLEIDLINGATHIDMGTHNRRVRLGSDCYLEVIAVDPQATMPDHPRWFGLDRTEEVRSKWLNGARLRGWVARTSDIDRVLRTHGSLLGSKKWLDDHFHFSVPDSGDLPMDGVLPSVIDVGDSPPTAESLEDQGIRLQSFILSHPNPSDVLALYEKLEIINPPTVVKGDRIGFSATVATSNGTRVLR